MSEDTGIEEESVVRKVKKTRKATTTSTSSYSEKEYYVYVMKFPDVNPETGIVDPFSMIRVREDLLVTDENRDAFSDVFKVKESDIKTLFKDVRAFFRGKATEDSLKIFFDRSIRFKKDEVKCLEEEYDSRFSKWYEEEDVV